MMILTRGIKRPFDVAVQHLHRDLPFVGGTDMNVAANVPAFLSVVGGSSTKKLGHTPSKRMPHRNRRSKFSNEFFCCKLRFCLGSEVVRRHDAANSIGLSVLGTRLGKIGRAPVPSFSRVSDNRKLRDISHDRLGE